MLVLDEVTKRFVELFNQERDFYECHEIFEAAWKGTDIPQEKWFYKALVQVATAQFKLNKGLLNGVRKLFAYSYEPLNQLPDTFYGIQIARLRRDFQQQIERLPDVDRIEEGSFSTYGLHYLFIEIVD